MATYYGGAVLDLTYARLHEQYLRSLRLTNITHWLAIILAVSAGAILAWTLALLLLGEAYQPRPGAALLLGGPWLGLLSIAVFLHAASARKTLVILIDTLRTDWKLNEAARLAANITDTEVRTRLFTTLALQWSGSVPTHSMIAEIAGKPAAGHALTPPAPSQRRYRWREHFRDFSGRSWHGRHLVPERKYYR